MISLTKAWHKWPSLLDHCLLFQDHCSADLIYRPVLRPVTWLLLPPKMQCYYSSLCLWISVHLCCRTWMSAWWEEQYSGLQHEIRHLLKGHVYRIYLGYQWQLDICLSQTEVAASLGLDIRLCGTFLRFYFIFKKFGKISTHRKCVISTNHNYKLWFC